MLQTPQNVAGALGGTRYRGAGLGALGAGGDEGAARPSLPAPQPVAVGDIPRINGIIMKRYSK